MGTAGPQNIHLTGIHNGINRPIKLLVRCFFHRTSNDINVLIQNRPQQLRRLQILRSNLQALYTSEPAADHFLHSLLQFRISRITDLCCKPDNGGFTDAHSSPQFGSRHKSHLIIMLLNIFGNPFLSFGKARHFFMNPCN